MLVLNLARVSESIVQPYLFQVGSCRQTKMGNSRDMLLILSPIAMEARTVSGSWRRFFLSLNHRNWHEHIATCTHMSTASQCVDAFESKHALHLTFCITSNAPSPSAATRVLLLSLIVSGCLRRLVLASFPLSIQ